MLRMKFAKDLHLAHLNFLNEGCLAVDLHRDNHV